MDRGTIPSARACAYVHFVAVRTMKKKKLWLFLFFLLLRLPFLLVNGWMYE